MADALDDAAAADGEDNDEGTTTESSSFLNPNDPKLDLKLNALEAAATAETRKLVAGAASSSEEAGLEADALEAFVRGTAGVGGSGEHIDGHDGAWALGDEEERLLQMVRIRWQWCR